MEQEIFIVTQVQWAAAIVDYSTAFTNYSMAACSSFIK